MSKARAYHHYYMTSFQIVAENDFEVTNWFVRFKHKLNNFKIAQPASFVMSRDLDCCFKTIPHRTRTPHTISQKIMKLNYTRIETKKKQKKEPYEWNKTKWNEMKVVYTVYGRTYGS